MSTETRLNDRTVRREGAANVMRATDVGIHHNDVRADLRAQRDEYIQKFDQSKVLLKLGALAGLLGIASLILAKFDIFGMLFTPLGVLGVVGMFLALLYDFYTSASRRRLAAPIRWHCFNCDKSLNDVIVWTCGHCDFRNRRRYLLTACESCLTAPASFECPHCLALTYFTEDRVARLPARTSPPEPDGSNANQHQDREVRQAQELAASRHKNSLLELERDQIRIQIDIARAKKDWTHAQEPAISPHQSRINRMAERIEDAKVTCKSMKEVALHKASAIAEIETDSECPPEVKPGLKTVVGTYFEAIEQDLMRSIPLH